MTCQFCGAPPVSILFCHRKHRALRLCFLLLVVLVAIWFLFERVGVVLITERRLELEGADERKLHGGGSGMNNVNVLVQHAKMTLISSDDERAFGAGGAAGGVQLKMAPADAVNGKAKNFEPDASVIFKRQHAKHQPPSAGQPEASLEASSEKTKLQPTYEAEAVAVEPPLALDGEPGGARCTEVRRRVSQGVLDFIRDYGDDELRALIAPIFTKKKLVLWSVDHHFGPVSDLRGLFEPLGVEFLEHTLYSNCALMCTCDQLSSSPVFDATQIIYPDSDVLEQYYMEARRNPDFRRADTVLVTYTTALLQAYKRLKKSVILIETIRYEYTMYWEETRWKEVTAYIAKLVSHRRNVVAANNLYDVHYVSYFAGAEPDLVQNFCAYTGAHYNPVRASYLYARRPNQPVDEYWSAPFEAHYAKLNATFRVFKLTELYKHYEYSDVAAHLGVVYLPYQVSLMSFFEQYTMGVPIFAPSLELLVKLHIDHHLVYDRTIGYMQMLSGSYLPRHPSYGGPPKLDPNDDFSEESIRYWLSFSDFQQVPHVTHFASAEHLVETLHSMTTTQLITISDRMMQFNRQRLKRILQYWRRRLLDIASYSPHRPH